jgi:hypothetical protein
LVVVRTLQQRFPAELQVLVAVAELEQTSAPTGYRYTILISYAQP